MFSVMFYLTSFELRDQSFSSSPRCILKIDPGFQNRDFVLKNGWIATITKNCIPPFARSSVQNCVTAGTFGIFAHSASAVTFSGNVIRVNFMTNMLIFQSFSCEDSPFFDSVFERSLFSFQ